jgi:hypothetical protein
MLEDREERIKRKILEILKEKGDEGTTVPELCVSDADEEEVEDAFFELELEEKVELLEFRNFVREDGGLFSIGVYKLKG